MVISFAILDFIEGDVIAAIIVLNICVGFYQDYRAEQTIASLMAMAAPVCKVIRDNGNLLSVKAEEAKDNKAKLDVANQQLLEIFQQKHILEEKLKEFMFGPKPAEEHNQMQQRPIWLQQAAQHQPHWHHCMRDLVFFEWHVGAAQIE